MQHFLSNNTMPGKTITQGGMAHTHIHGCDRSPEPIQSVSPMTPLVIHTEMDI